MDSREVAGRAEESGELDAERFVGARGAQAMALEEE
jgi:hypothetical protein